MPFDIYNRSTSSKPRYVVFGMYTVFNIETPKYNDKILYGRRLI
jgi:hypothetical protein